MLELLITMTIFSAIMGLLMSSYFQFHQQNQRIESILSLRQELRILEKLLREDLQSVVYLDKFMSPAKRRYNTDLRSGLYAISEVGENEDEHMDVIHMHVKRRSLFLRTLPLSQDPELHEVSYYLEKNEETEKLEFKRREEFYVDTDITEGDESIIHAISERVVSFNLEFYRERVEEADDEWDSTGGNRNQTRLPAGIKVTLVMKDPKEETLESSFEINLRPKMGQTALWSK